MLLHRQDLESEDKYIWRMCRAKDTGEIDMSWDELADVINRELGYEDKPYSEAAYRKPYQSAKRFLDAGCFDNNRAEIKQADQPESIERTVENIQSSYGAETRINKDGTYTSNKLVLMNDEESKNPDFVMEAHGFNPEMWKLISTRNTIRQVISKSDGVNTLYASYITVKPLTESEIPLSKIEEFFDRLDRNYSLPEIRNNYDYLHGDKLLLIDIADLHMNLQASVFTAGNEYNCDIAEKLFFHVINDVITRTERYTFDEIVFVIGGDALNGDNLFGSTTKGTPQNSDLHYYDAYERLCAMTIKAVDILKEFAKVNVIYCPGNHDEVTGFKLAKYVDAWFRNDDRVLVDYTPLARKYKLYGSTLLCFAHDGKVDKLPTLIADEAREYWGQAETVEVFLQHLHREQILIEENNIRIQRLPTISARSKWSYDKGYKSKRQCKSFVFDKSDGLTDILYTPIKA